MRTVKLLLVLALVGCGRINFGPRGGDGPPLTQSWVRSFGTPTIERVSAIAFDRDGDILLAGGSLGSLDFGQGPLANAGGFDGFVLKLSRDGTTVRWVKPLQTAGTDTVSGLAALDAGGAVVTGSSSGNVWIEAYDANGAVKWTHLDGDTALQEGAAVATHGVRVDVVGLMSGVVDFGGSTTPLSAGTMNVPFMVSLLDDGTATTARTYTATQAAPQGADLSLDGGTRVTVGGFAGTLDLGVQTHTSLGLGDAYIVAENAAGAIWSRQWGAARGDGAIAVAADDTSIVVAGYACGTVDFGGGPQTSNCTADTSSDIAIARYELATGAYRWSTMLDASLGNGNAARAVAMRSDGFVVAGTFHGTVDFGPEVFTSTVVDGFVSLYDTTNAPVWTLQISSVQEDYAIAVAADERGIVVAGTYRAAATIGDELLPTAGGDDIFVVMVGE